MPQSLRWSQLVVGLAALGAVTAAAVLILFFGRVDRLHGRTISLFVTTEAARGVIRGTEVWLGGQKVGMVKSVAFLPPSVAPADRVLLRLEVLEHYRRGIRTNARAQIRAGASLIAAPVVAISIGSRGAREVRDGDTLRALPQADFEEVASQFGMASRDFPRIIANLKVLAAGLQSTEGTLGAMFLERGGDELPAARAGASRLLTRVTTPSGTIGMALASATPLTARVQHVLARADSVRQLLASERTSFGRLRRDSTLLAEVRDIRNELDILRARLASPNGTAGRLLGDSAIVDAVGRTQREMTALFADMKRHPFRYVAF